MKEWEQTLMSLLLRDIATWIFLWGLVSLVLTKITERRDEKGDLVVPIELAHLLIGVVVVVVVTIVDWHLKHPPVGN